MGKWLEDSWSKGKQAICPQWISEAIDWQDMIAKGRHPTFKLTATQANEMREWYVNGETQKSIAGAYHVDPSCVSKIVHNKRQREVYHRNQ